MVGRPVVGVLMSQDDRDDIAEVDQRVGERSGVDDEGLSRLADGEGGMVMLGDSHASSQQSAMPVGKPLDDERVAGDALDHGSSNLCGLEPGGSRHRS